MENIDEVLSKALTFFVYTVFAVGFILLCIGMMISGKSERRIEKLGTGNEDKSKWN